MLFAFDVTDYAQYRTAEDADPDSFGGFQTPREWSLRRALARSAQRTEPFLVEPIRPDARMQAQNGLFISGAVPVQNGLDGLDGISFASERAPGADALAALLSVGQRTRGRPQRLKFCAMVVPPRLKKSMIRHLTTTYNKTEQSLFPDMAGFKDALLGNRVALTVKHDLVLAHEDGPAAEDSKLVKRRVLNWEEP